MQYINARHHTFCFHTTVRQSIGQLRYPTVVSAQT